MPFCLGNFSAFRYLQIGSSIPAINRRCNGLPRQLLRTYEHFTRQEKMCFFNITSEHKISYGQNFFLFLRTRIQFHNDHEKKCFFFVTNEYNILHGQKKCFFFVITNKYNILHWQKKVSCCYYRREKLFTPQKKWYFWSHTGMF